MTIWLVLYSMVLSTFLSVSAWAMTGADEHSTYSRATTSEKKVEKVIVNVPPAVTEKPKRIIPVMDSSKLLNRGGSGSANRKRSVDVQPSAPVFSPTKEDFAKVAVGLTRADVIGKLGPPAASLTMPEEDHLVETLSYQSKGAKIATIRLSDGAVSAVQIY